MGMFWIEFRSFLVENEVFIFMQVFIINKDDDNIFFRDFVNVISFLV